MEPQLQEVAQKLRKGGLLAWPTDTTWGLLAAAEPEAVERIYGLKGRPRSKPLQLLAASLEDARRLVDEEAAGQAWQILAKRFWPGGLTLVAPASAAAPPALVHAGKVGLRVPASDELRELIAAVGGLVAATSLNRSGQPPVTSYAEALAFAEEVDYVQPGESGTVASSVYELPEGRLLRSGLVSASEIATALEETWTKN